MDRPRYELAKVIIGYRDKYGAKCQLIDKQNRADAQVKCVLAAKKQAKPLMLRLKEFQNKLVECEGRTLHER